MEEIMQYIELIQEFKPVVDKVLENLKEYESAYKQISDFAINQTVESRSKIYLGLIANGIPPEHALAITVSVVSDFKDAVKAVKIKSK